MDLLFKLSFFIRSLCLSSFLSSSISSFLLKRSFCAVITEFDLLSFNEDDTENIYNVIEYFKGQFNGNILPIAMEPSGDYFCIDLTKNSIVYWNHENDVLTSQLMWVTLSFILFIYLFLVVLARSLFLYGLFSS